MLSRSVITRCHIRTQAWVTTEWPRTPRACFGPVAATTCRWGLWLHDPRKRGYLSPRGAARAGGRGGGGRAVLPWWRCCASTAIAMDVECAAMNAGASAVDCDRVLRLLLDADARCDCVRDHAACDRGQVGGGGRGAGGEGGRGRGWGRGRDAVVHIRGWRRWRMRDCCCGWRLRSRSRSATRRRRARQQK